MKLRNSFAILAFSAAFLLASCGGGNNPGGDTSTPAGTSSSTSSKAEGKITVTFDSNGGSYVAPQSIDVGGTVTEPEDPTKDGYEFLFWAVDASLTTGFDFTEKVYADMTLYAAWSEATTSASIDEDAIYFREATWWNSEKGVTYVSVDGAGVTDDGVGELILDFDALIPMDYVSTVRIGATEYFNYWTLDIGYLTEAETIQFVRCGPVYQDGEPTEEMSYWGACSPVLPLSERGENNMYDLLGLEKPSAWADPAPEGATKYVEGLWSIYNPDADVPYVPGGDSSEPSGDIRDPHGPEGSELVEWYIVGEGTLFSGWGSGTKLQMYSNPNSATDKGCLQDVYFGEGDIFKVTDLDKTWFGYEGVDKYESPENLGLTNFEGVDDGYGGSNFKCIVEGYYDVYVNGSGVFWITESSGPLAE